MATETAPISDNPLLNRLAHFAGFDPSASKALDALFATRKTVAKGRDLVADGSPASEIILLVRGWAARYKLLADGSRQILSLLLPGDVFPIHVLPVGAMDHGIVALTRCDFAEAGVGAFDTAVLHDARLAQAFWWISIQEKGMLRAWLVSLGRRDARARIAHLMCETAERLRMAGLNSVGAFEFPLTQEQIADAQGLTPVHTNRILQRLRRDGLIQLEEKRLTIADPERLARIAGFEPTYLYPGGRSRSPHSLAGPSDTFLHLMSAH